MSRRCGEDRGPGFQESDFVIAAWVEVSKETGSLKIIPGENQLTLSICKNTHWVIDDVEASHFRLRQVTLSADMASENFSASLLYRWKWRA